MNLNRLKSDSGRTEEIIERLTLFDDQLMSKVFCSNLEAVTLLLRIILQRDDLQVLNVHSQKRFHNPIVEGRNIQLDIVAADQTGKLYNIEVQKENKGAHVKRARFHSAMLDSTLLKKNQKFHELSDSYVIFITLKDYLGKGLPLYHIDRTCIETNELINDGAHIVYVNGTWRGEDPLGDLMHDFSCADPEDCKYEELKKGIRHFKKEGGKSEMSDLIEEYAQEAAREAAEKSKIEGLKEGRIEGLKEGRIEGLKEGRIEGTRENLINNLKCIMGKFQLTLEQAMQTLNVADDEREVIRSLMK
ncbi:MAG: PD-(D/E)XK nuclease family transposase [Erysipelotrichaceae bacterium]|nr:PD-(D/E)XK nuclease family transposase [Erysipelotrichaceae bacterium]